MTNKQYRVAVVGAAGTWGRYYTRAYAAHPDCEIICLVDRARERRDAIARRYGVEKVYDDSRRPFGSRGAGHCIRGRSGEPELPLRYDLRPRWCAGRFLREADFSRTARGRRNDPHLSGARHLVRLRSGRMGDAVHARGGRVGAAGAHWSADGSGDPGRVAD